MNAITIFDGPVAEYKTKKAAVKFAARIVGGARVVRSLVSAVDMYHEKGKPIYQVYANN